MKGSKEGRKGEKKGWKERKKKRKEGRKEKGKEGKEIYNRIEPYYVHIPTSQDCCKILYM